MENHGSILLVDDEEDIRDVVGMSLADIGYTVHTAENGEKALDLFRHITPPIVLTDIKMPGIDGIELCQLLRERSEFSQTPVIFLSAWSDADIQERAFAAGATQYLVKPFLPQDLLAIVKELTGELATDSVD